MKKYNASLSGKIFKCFYIALFFFLLSLKVGCGQTTLLNEPFTNSLNSWSTTVGSGDAIATTNSNSAGGTAYEAKITGSSQSSSITDRLYYGPINTTGYSSLTLQWNNYMDYYSSSYAYSMAVQTSSDGITWHNTTWVTNPVTADLGPGLQSITINTTDVGSSTFYIAFTINGLTFGMNYWYIDNVLLQGISSCTAPSTQATIGAYTNNTTGNTLTANWSRGTTPGDGVIVVARPTSATLVDPSSGTSYTSNAAFGSGSATGTNNYVVYKGTGTTVNVTGLTPNTSYTFTVYEYNNTGSCYKIAGSSSAVTTANTTATYTSSSTWTAPCGVTSVTAECWGAGGGGGSSNNTTTNGGSGGGGGGYSKGTHTVVPSSSYYYKVGTGGTGGPASSTTAPTAGTFSWFNCTPSTNSAPGSSAAGTLANGGGAGVNNSTATPSNAAAVGYGNTTATAGNNGVAGTSSGGGAGGAGANGGAGGAGSTSTNGTIGSSPGGGGGGSDDATARKGGDGAIGQVTLTWTIPQTATPTVTSPICSNTTTINGTSAEANGTVITVYKGGAYLGNTTVSSNAWSLTGITLTAGDVITATANNSCKTLSSASSSVTVISCDPTITTTGTLSAFSTCSGTASAYQSFTVSGTFLTANIVITAPTGFEVSTSSGSGYGSSLSLTPSGGTVSTTTIYVRLTSTATGSPSGNVTCASTGATPKNVAVSGSAYSNLSAVNVTATTPQSICANGTGTVLTAAETNGGTITGRQWGKRSVSGGAITAISGATGSTYTPTGTGLTAGTWYIVCTSTPTCGSAVISNEVTVTVNSNPTISGTTTICPSTTTTLTGSITPGTWGSSNTGIATVNSSGVVTGIAAGSATITYTVTATGCTATASVTVSTAPSAVTVTPSSANVCSGGIQSLVASGGNTGSIQASNYTFTPSSGTFTPLSGGTTVSSIQADDEISSAIPIGFNYNYSGNSYSSVYASSNGFLSFNSAASTTASNSLSAPSTSIIPLLAPLWDDLDGTTAGTASYLTTGTAGSRIFTFEWLNWEWYYSANVTVISFQVKLYESDGHVEFIYRQEANAATAGSASIGITGTTVGNYLSLNGTGTSPSASSSTETATLTGTRPASGQIYAFIPPQNPITWSPTTELYTNAGATIAYTGTSTTTVYAKPTATRTYTATATSGCSTSGSSTLTVSVGGVTINTQPVATTKCAGETATFTVSASSSVGLTYQWRKGGVNINTVTYPSAATATLTLTNVSASDAGNYDVVITPACGSSATSNAVALTVNPAATVTLASNSPAVAAASIYLSSTKNPIYRFTLATNNNGINATLTQLTFTTTNTSASDITKYQLWYNSSDVLSSATQIGSDITSSLGSGTHTFSSLSQAINANTTGYFWITTDVASGATPSNTIVVSALTTSNITATYSNGCGNITGSTSASGTQTIGCYSISGTVSVGSGQTYTSLTGTGGLFAVINSCGLSGNLTVNITSDLTEDGTNGLNQWTGAYTVTIQPSAATLRTISGNVSQAMIRLNGADGLTIDGRSGGSGQYLKFKNTNTSNAVISIANASTNNTIKYCLIEAGEYGIYQSDATSTTNTINNCSIYDFDYYGVYLSASTSTTVSQNQIYQTSQKSSSCYGIYLGDAPSTIIEKNKIYNLLPASSSSAYGIYYIGSSGVSMNVIIRNNMIALSPNNDYYVYGIEYNGYTANSCDIYFNSIYIGGSGTSAYSSYGIAKADAATTFNCKNNIVYNNRTASTANQYALYFSNTTGTINCDYNNLYSPTATYGYVGYWSSTNCQTIANWRTSSSKDANSFNVNPNYTSTTSPFDLHLTTGSCKTGTTISGISDDYDSQSRTTPCIGADEVIVCSGTPTAGTATASSSTACSGSLSTISVTGATTGYSGLTYQWQSSSDNSSWSDISAATGLSYSAYPTANTYYRRKITCSGSSTYSSSVLVSIVTCFTMDNTPVSTCSGLFYDSGGASGNYSISESYTKTFTSATAGDALQFTFSSFNTESVDKLYVYDGSTTSSPQITGSPFSGSTIPSTILSSGNSLTFQFTSDGSVVYAGWEASIACVPITVPNCATLASPTNGITTICPGSGATLTWTAPASGFAPTSYQVYFGTNNPPTNLINGTDVGNVNTYATGPLGSNTTYYWKIVPVNSIGVNSTCTTVYSFTTQNISISSTNSPVTTCLNTATLTATGGGTINWYSQPTGGSSLGTGGSYNPTFSGNTTYYVGASNGSTSIYTTGLSGPSTSSLGSSSMGLWFTTSAPLTINTVDVYVTTAGTNLTVHLQNSSSTDILTQSFTNLPAGKNTLTLNFSIPTAGTYILVSKDGVSLGYESSYSSYPITIAGVLSITSGEWYGTDSSIYGYFYNWSVTAGTSCESARVPVNVIHTASPITITPDGLTTFALGGSVGLTASSSASPAYTYTWTPSSGLNTTTGATVTATPSNTTTYTVTGTNGTPCTQTATVTVEVILPCTGLGSTGVTNISSLPYSISGKSLVGTGNEITSSTAIVCGSADYYTGEDAVYIFTPTVSGSSTITLTATVGTYTGLMLYNGCPMNGQGGSCVSYSQSSTGSKSMCVSLNAGTTYYLVVDYYSSSATVPSNYSLSISAPDPLSTPNDLPCNAQIINSGDLTPGENTCATGVGEPVAPSCWTNGNLNTVWYKLTTGASQTSIKVKTVVGSLLNTQIALYSGTCGSGMSMITCNDDVTACGSSSYYNSEITATVTPNTTYYVAVDGYSDLTGTFSIVWTDGASAWPSVPGQDCGTEVPVCSSTFAIGNPGYQAVGNNCDFGTSYCLASGERGSAWYQIKINGDGDLSFTIEPNDATVSGTLVTDDGTDYDWAIWKKTGTGAVTCAQIAAGTATPLRCNYSYIGITGLYPAGITPSGNTYTGHTYTSGAYDAAFEDILHVLNGESYYLVISNFSNSLSGFTINLLNSTNTFDFTIPDPLIWTGGAASTDWFDSRNWGNCAVYPDDTRNCVIAASSSYQPIINAANAKCKSITINPGAKLTINNGYNLDVYGNYNNQGSLVANPTSSVTMVGSIAQTMDGIMVSPSEFNNLIINKTGNQVTLNQNLETSGNLTLSSSGYGLNGNSNNISVSGDITMANTTFTPGTGTFTIIGTSTTHTINAGNNVFNNFTMNQTGNITLSNNNVSLNSSGVLTLTNGVINTGSYQLIVNNTNPIAVNDGNSASYINGNIRRYFASNTGTYAFPVGTASAYRLAEIINNSMTGISYIDGKFSSTFTSTGSLNGSIANDLGTPYTSFATEGIWTLTPDAQPASGSYNINLWFNGGGANAFSGLTDYTFGPLKRSNSATAANVWSSQGGSISASVGRTFADGFAYRSGWNTFSEFGIGKASGALPVTLLSAQLICENNTKKIIWSTASELNNNYFSILTSTNAIDFVERARIPGAGNANTTNHYQWIDTTSESNQVMYYQLKQTDNDGICTSLSLLSGNCNDNQDGDIIIISNPNNPNIEALFVGDLSGKYNISVVNYLGQIVLLKDIDLEKNGKKILLPKKGLASGLYNVVFKSKNSIVTKQVLVSY